MGDEWLEALGLEPDQEQLLAAMVEAERTVPRPERRPFILAESGDGSHLLHQGMSNAMVYKGDLMTLAERGLLRQDFGSRGSPLFDITPEGRRYYEYLKRRSGEPLSQVAEETRAYLDGDQFRSAFPDAYKLWLEASDALWAADSLAEFTSIGHKCREAMQAFATALVLKHNPPGVDENPAHTVARLRAVIAEKLPKSTVAEFTEALAHYWGVVSDLAQRQEHGRERKGRPPLEWEDARRIVFQTAMVMFEVARALR